MHKKAHPVRSTIVYGFTAALLFLPAVTLLGKILTFPLAFRLAVWVIILGYSYLLASWSDKGMVKIILPLLILLTAALWSDSIVFFLMLTIMILGWVRQNCFMTDSSVKGLLVEVFISGGAAALILFFNPHSTPSLAISTWLFFLVQALYFVFFSPAGPAGDVISRDRFARACTKAEEILSA